MTCFAGNGEIQIAFEDLGGTGGEPLLLVMGLGASRFWWPDGLVDELVGRGFHVAAYDQRDAGESTHLPDRRARSPLSALIRERERRTAPAYSAEDLTDDAVAVLDALGWPRAHIFGHSMGGLVAQRTAIRHPQRVLTVITSSAVPSDVRGLSVLRYVRLKTVARFARLHYPETPEGYLDLAVAVARNLGPGQDLDERDVREFVDKEAAHHVTSLRDAKAQSRQIGAKWHSGPLARITAPTLVLHGARDPLLRPTAARDIAAAVSTSRLRVIPGVGHFISRDYWTTYAGEIRDYADANRERLPKTSSTAVRNAPAKWGSGGTADGS